MSALQKFALWSLIILLIGSVGARAALLSQEPSAPSGTSAALAPSKYLASTQDPSTPATPDQKPAAKPAKSADAPAKSASTEGQPEALGGLGNALPYITEGSLFSLIGFALGYATRKVFKVSLALLALGFVGLQAASYFGMIDVDWSPVLSSLNNGVLNLKENESIAQFAMHRLPSLAALAVGSFIGFQRATTT
jgi:uncharacterized membrane protein (Fun14 family)